LREAARRFHEPEKGRIAIWIDLKTRRVGHSRSIDDAWTIIAEELLRYGLVEKKNVANMRLDKLLESIRTWIDESPGRRILLLLDEADEFLRIDGTRTEGHKWEDEFSRSARLKSLMDLTDRRFKVVFAGLHNVQRTTRLANHPLAHYGEPLCIGPLLDNMEWREAEKLIRMPLEAIGYSISTDIVHRILALTNYYPNLIQLFCKELISFLVREHTQAFELAKCPPRVIQARHIGEAYRSENLRKQIRDRFVWTLQLDQRYEVIAYAMALEHMEYSGEGQVVFSAKHLREMALSWWPEGFWERASQEEFRSLLEEMVGLGVLRCSEGNYAFRNANVIRLIGTKEEIENMLQQERELATEFTPAYGRAIVNDEKGWLRLSALTAEQENEFRKPESSVILHIFNPLTNYGALKGELRAGLGKTRIWIGDGSFSPERHILRKEFQQRLKKLDDGVTVILFSENFPWSLQTLQECTEIVGPASMAKHVNKHLHISFSVDPRRLWQLLQDNPLMIDLLEEDYIRTLSQSKWHDWALRTWIEEQSEYAEWKDPSKRKTISTITGNWPRLIDAWDECLRQCDYAFDKALSEYEVAWRKLIKSEKTIQRMGFEKDDDVRTILMRSLIEMEEAGVSEPDLVELTQIDPMKVRSVLEWASRLGYIKQGRDFLWGVDPIVKRIVAVQADA